jgi:hypothetical protein
MISIELTARDDSCTSEVDLMRKYPEFEGGVRVVQLGIARRLS